MDILKVIKNFNPKAIKYTGDAIDGFSVLVKDKKSGLELWLDVFVRDGDVSVDWNQYIFFLNDEDDAIKKQIQEDAYVYDICSSEVISHLQDNKQIIQTDMGLWY